MNNKGSILIVSLWILAVLSVLALGLSYNAQQKLHIIKNLEDRNKLRVIIESGIKEAIAKYGYERPDFSLKDTRIQISLEDIKDKNSISPGSQRYVMMDENRKININSADVETLKSLFNKVGGLEEDSADRLAYSVIDYRDADDDEKKYYHTGSEKYSYKADGLSHGPKNASFELLSELLLVNGMTPDVYKKIESDCTVYGNGLVNINTASRNVLTVLGMDEDLALSIVNLRNGEDGLKGSPDDRIFINTANIADDIEAGVRNITPEQRRTIDSMLEKNLLTITSSHFSFTGTAKLDGMTGNMTISCVHGVDSGITYWTEN